MAHDRLRVLGIVIGKSTSRTGAFVSDSAGRTGTEQKVELEKARNCVSTRSQSANASNARCDKKVKEFCLSVSVCRSVCLSRSVSKLVLHSPQQIRGRRVRSDGDTDAGTAPSPHSSKHNFAIKLVLSGWEEGPHEPNSKSAVWRIWSHFRVCSFVRWFLVWATSCSPHLEGFCRSGGGAEEADTKGRTERGVVAQKRIWASILHRGMMPKSCDTAGFVIGFFAHKCALLRSLCDSPCENMRIHVCSSLVHLLS